MSRRSHYGSMLRHHGPALLIALAAGAAVLATMDPAGSYPQAPAGPGLTSDEPFNVQQGVFLAQAVRHYGWGILHPASLQEIFGHPNYLPDHPPLGRFCLGLAHHVTCHLAPPHDSAGPFAVICARSGSAVAFFLLIGVLGATAVRWYGRIAGVVTALAIVLMPRLFAHAHLAALETWMNLGYAVAVLAIAGWWTTQAPPTKTTAAWTGCLFGLALLIKMQAILLPVPIGLWALRRWRRRALLPLLIWGATGLLVFFLGWPWLWRDPLNHGLAYFGRTAERAELFVWYFGRRYADHAVPWHYPAVLFLTTVPFGLQLLGFVGVFRGKPPGWKASREQLILGCLVFPLVVFSWPGVVVYDGARLFLMVFPLWALLIGRGTALAADWLRARWSRRTADAVLVGWLALQSYGLIALHPTQLSYYNLTVGGLRGAADLGLERSYWGDSLTRRLLRATAGEVPRGAVVQVAPVLHGLQLDALQKASPILREHEIILQPFADRAEDVSRYVLLFRREADLPDRLRAPLPAAELLAEVRRENVQLAALYRLK